MTREKWRAVWDVYQAAVLLSEPEQRSFAGLQTDDPEVLGEVLALLERPDSLPAQPTPSLEPGTKIGRFSVLRTLGRGGMGEVYAAMDTQLNREVALKVIAPGVSRIPPSMHLSTREARAASALNHPNIVTVHEVIHSDYGVAIAMELVKGQTLRVLAKTSFSLDHVLDIVNQIAQAVDVAHAHNIVHRDIKPENIMLRRDGYVKLLDFGLAREFQGEEIQQEHNRTRGLFGTFAYMSPEQMSEESLTGASDIFSLGVVLYELCTGTHPFGLNSTLETPLLNPKTDPRPPCTLKAEISKPLSALILAMLAKDASLRPAASHVVRELAAIRANMRENTGHHRRRLVYGLLTAALLGIAAGGILLRDRKDQQPPSPATPLLTLLGDKTSPSFSPDGEQIAFAWNGERQDNFDIYTTRINDAKPVRLTCNPDDDYDPSWSPDGRLIAFRRGKPGEPSAVMLMPASGGRERRLATVASSTTGTFHSLDWSPDGKWLVLQDRMESASTESLFLISLSTQERRALTSPDKTQSDVNPSFSPDGKTLAFTRAPANGIGHLYLLPLSREYVPVGEPKQLKLAGFENVLNLFPEWTPDGREIVFSSNQSGRVRLWRVAADGGVNPQPIEMAGENAVYPRFSRKGRRLVYMQGIPSTGLWRVSLAGRQRGKTERMLASSRPDRNAQYSPDGQHIVFESDRSGFAEIWRSRSDGTDLRPLTRFQGPISGTPRWSPDGRRIAFDSRLSGQAGIYVMPAQGGEPKPLVRHSSSNVVPSWSRDGKSIYFASNRTGRYEVWKMPSEGGTEIQVTRNGGVAAMESIDRRFLYYTRGPTNPPTSLWRVPLEGGEETLVLGSISGRAFSVVREGIYYIPAGSVGPGWSLKFLSFTSPNPVKVTSFQQPNATGLTISPDGRYAVFPIADHTARDLMLIENFR